MNSEETRLLQEKMGDINYKKICDLKNDNLNRYILNYVQLCNPDTVFVRTDAPEDNEYIRTEAVKLGEEISLATEGHTIHFDGYYDQARDKSKTKYLLEEDQVLGSDINSEERQKGLDEVHELLKDSMVGKEMLI